MRLIPQALEPGNTLYVVAQVRGPTDVHALYAVAVKTNYNRRPVDDIIMLITSFDAIREDVSRTRRSAVLAHQHCHLLTCTVLCAGYVRQCVFAGGLSCNTATDGPLLNIEPMKAVSRSVRN